jgi:hypothetical protein
MEVTTIITSNKEVIRLFDTFIFSFPIFQLNFKDDDTAYFANIQNSKDMLFYHFILNDVEHEFSYNYKEAEISFIKRFFDKKEIYMVDLSYKAESTLTQLFKDFKKHLIERDKTLISEVLISHPFNGIRVLEYDY